MRPYFGSRKAVIVWLVVALWLTALTIGTLMFFLQGSDPSQSPWRAPITLAIFWCVGIGLAALAMRQPITSVSVQQGGLVTVRVRYPLRVERMVLSSEEALPLQLVEIDEPWEGSRVQLELATATLTGQRVVIAEGSREHCNEVRQKFLQALGGVYH